MMALVFDPVPMITGFLILDGGFGLFTTVLVAIGAVMPTAKEAGNFMGVMMALTFVPFYAISLIFSNPQAQRSCRSSPTFRLPPPSPHSCATDWDHWLLGTKRPSSSPSSLSARRLCSALP
jgi:hypothetical protein